MDRAVLRFLWAESYFYRKLLEAFGFFEPGPWQGIDPFAPAKRAELDAPAVATDHGRRRHRLYPHAGRAGPRFRRGRCHHPQRRF